MRAELENALVLAGNLPAAELPELLGELEQVKATAMQRLCTPAPVSQAQPADELLDVEEASHKLGVGKDFLYRNHARYPFTRRMGRSLRFSARGIEAYIKNKQ